MTPAKKAAYDEPLRQQWLQPGRHANLGGFSAWADLADDLSSAAPTVVPPEAADESRADDRSGHGGRVGGRWIVGLERHTADRRAQRRKAVSAKQVSSRPIDSKRTCGNAKRIRRQNPAAPVAVRKGTVPVSLNGAREESAEDPSEHLAVAKAETGPVHAAGFREAGRGSREDGNALL